MFAKSELLAPAVSPRALESSSDFQLHREMRAAFTSTRMCECVRMCHLFEETERSCRLLVKRENQSEQPLLG